MFLNNFIKQRHGTKQPQSFYYDSSVLDQRSCNFVFANQSRNAVTSALVCGVSASYCRSNPGKGLVHHFWWHVCEQALKIEMLLDSDEKDMKHKILHFLKFGN